MNDKKLYEELSKLNELVLHKGLVPTFEEIINQLDKQKEVLDKIKEYCKENIDDEFYNNLTNKEKALYKINELLEEIDNE